MIYQLHRENDALIEDVNAASPAYLLKRRRPTNGIDTRRAIDVHLEEPVGHARLGMYEDVEENVDSARMRLLPNDTRVHNPSIIVDH